MERESPIRKLTILCAEPGKETIWKEIIKEDVVDQTNITRLTAEVGNISFVDKEMPSGPDHIILEENCPFFPEWYHCASSATWRRSQDHVGIPEVIAALAPRTLVVMTKSKFERLLEIEIDTLEEAQADVQLEILKPQFRKEQSKRTWRVYVKKDSGEQLPLPEPAAAAPAAAAAVPAAPLTKRRRAEAPAAAPAAAAGSPCDTGSDGSDSDSNDVYATESTGVH